MAIALDIFIIASLALGCFFALTGALGILRMPDFFSRQHPAGKTDSAGLALIALGLLGETLKYEYGMIVAAKLGLIVLFVLITGPAAVHAIAKSALLAGLKPWRADAQNRSTGATRAAEEDDA